VIGFVAILVITLIFGRVYCSFLCPLGTLQDVFIAVSRKNGRRQKHSFQKPHNLLRYALFGAVVVTASLGSMSLLNLLDPYLMTGRIFTQFVQPFFWGIYNAAVSVMQYFHIYFSRRMSFRSLFPYC